MTTNIFRGRAVATLAAAALAITALTSCSTAAPEPAPKPAVEQPVQTPIEKPAEQPVQERITFPEGETTMNVDGAVIECEPDPETGPAVSVRTTPVAPNTPGAVTTSDGQSFTYSCGYELGDDLMKQLEEDGLL